MLFEKFYAEGGVWGRHCLLLPMLTGDCALPCSAALKPGDGAPGARNGGGPAWAGQPAKAC